MLGIFYKVKKKKAFIHNVSKLSANQVLTLNLSFTVTRESGL